MTTRTGKTRLAALAGAERLSGAVCVTDAKGQTHHYATEDEAEAAWGSKAGSLEHRRGAFFEKAAAPKSEPKVEVERAPVEEEKPKRSSKRSRKSGDSD